MNAPLASVVIPSFGNYDTLRRALDGYAAQSIGAESFEVIVVADTADPEPAAVERAIGSRPYEVQLLTGSAPGASANRNAGIEAARAPIVVFSDNDTIPVRSLIEEHLGWHDKFTEDNIGVQGRVRWAPELRVTTFMRWLDTGIQFDFENIKGIEAGWGRFISANVSVKRTFAEQVGGFDQVRFPFGYEDTDWAYRASKRGFRLLYNRRAVVHHLRDMSLEFWQRRARRVAASEFMFVKVHPELSPWFHGLFSTAAAEPPGRGRGLRFAPFVSSRVPWLGPRVWQSVDLWYKQAIAPHFLSAWEEAASRPVSVVRPDLSEFEGS